jgi:hypothetical protein
LAACLLAQASLIINRLKKDGYSFEEIHNCFNQFVGWSDSAKLRCHHVVNDPSRACATGGDSSMTQVYKLSSPVRSIEIGGGRREPFTIVNLALDKEQDQSVFGATIPGLEEIVLNDERVSSVIAKAQSLLANELLFESNDDYSQFDLSPPAQG